MQVAKPFGRHAASRKYDILSALAVFALSHDKYRQRQILRLMALITARYNWERDELSIGQGEIARLWSVDERTVKREMARLRAAGWLVLKRQGARGRVSVHGLDLGRMLADTRPVWPSLGADFAHRVGASDPVPAAGNVVRLHPVVAPPADGTLWSRMQALLHHEDAAAYATWFRHLGEVSCGDGRLTLVAPSRFHAQYVTTHLADRMLMAARRVDVSVAAVEIVV